MQQYYNNLTADEIAGRGDARKNAMEKQFMVKLLLNLR